MEAIDKDGSIGKEKLQAQCDEYAALFGIAAEDYCSLSYSDMILQKVMFYHSGQKQSSIFNKDASFFSITIERTFAAWQKT